jgi:hypothetical protein
MKQYIEVTNTINDETLLILTVEGFRFKALYTILGEASAKLYESKEFYESVAIAGPELVYAIAVGYINKLKHVKAKVHNEQ